VNTPVHRDTDSRVCGASTTVIGQSTVFVNNLLASVQGDTNTHSNGALGATNNDGTVFINNKKVVLKGSSASPDRKFPPLGPPHNDPKSVGASPNVFACGGAGAGVPPDDSGPDPRGSDLYPDPNARSASSVAAEEAAARDATAANDPSRNLGASPPPSDPGEAANRAYQYFIDQGYTPAQASGIVGNLINESGLNPSAVNPNDAGPGRDSFGLAQWNRERLSNLQSFAASRGTNASDFDTQLAFIDHELRGTGGNGGGSERAAYNRLISTNDPQRAAEAFSTYERYKGYELGLQGRETQQRAAQAENIFNINNSGS
jgi:hypothetical protein